MHSRINLALEKVNTMIMKQTKRGVVLSENALYATVRVTKFSPFKTDKKRSRELAKDNGASRDAVKVQTRIFSKNFDAKVTAKESEIRANHYTYTFEVPSSGGKQSRGHRIVSTRIAEDYLARQQSLKDEFEILADELVQDYENKIEGEKVRLGDLFNPSDYPHPDVVRSAYSADVDVDAIPAVEDIDVGRFTESQRAKAEKRQQEAIDGITRELLQRMRDGVGTVRARLDKMITDPKGARLHDSVFENLAELVNTIIPACDIADSPELQALATEVKKLVRYSPDAIRTTVTAQKAIAKEAKAVEKKMASYF